MHLFLEKGMRGGISCISKGYSKSGDDIDIMYWDMNNLYGTVTSFDYLPEGFKWLSKEEINSFDIYSVKKNSNIGYILEVDLHYSKEMHHIHNDYPLCPEHISIIHEMLSNHCKDIVDK